MLIIMSTWCLSAWYDIQITLVTWRLHARRGRYGSFIGHVISVRIVRYPNYVVKMYVTSCLCMPAEFLMLILLVTWYLYVRRVWYVKILVTWRLFVYSRGSQPGVPVHPRGTSGAIRGYRDFTDSSSEKNTSISFSSDRMTVGGCWFPGACWRWPLNEPPWKVVSICKKKFKKIFVWFLRFLRRGTGRDYRT